VIHLSFSERIRFLTLLLGVIQVTMGCLVGLIPPDAIAWYRGLVMAHIQFTANGVLLVVQGFLLREMVLSPLLLRFWFVSIQRYLAQWGGRNDSCHHRPILFADARVEQSLSTTHSWFQRTGIHHTGVMRFADPAGVGINSMGVGAGKEGCYIAALASVCKRCCKLLVFCIKLSG